MGDPCIIDWTRLTTSGIVSHKACLFYGIILSETGSTARSGTVYDGDGIGGKCFGVLICPGRSSRPIILPKPVKFERGLYVEFESGLNEVTVLWQPL